MPAPSCLLMPSMHFLPTSFQSQGRIPYHAHPMEQHDCGALTTGAARRQDAVSSLNKKCSYSAPDLVSVAE